MSGISSLTHVAGTSKLAQALILTGFVGGSVAAGAVAERFAPASKPDGKITTAGALSLVGFGAGWVGVNALAGRPSAVANGGFVGAAILGFGSMGYMFSSVIRSN